MKRLRLLWELRNRGTISAVAAALNYSPSAVSQQLAVLEREAGVRLMEKSGRGLILTVPGEALAQEAEVLLAGLERAEAAVHRARDAVAGTIRVATFQTALIALFPGALRRLRRRHPKMRVEVTQYEPGEALEETWMRGFDVVVAEHYPGHASEHFPGLDRHALLSDPIRLALPPRGVGDERFDAAQSLADVAWAPWAMEPHPAATRHWAEQMCRVAGFEPEVLFETADLRSHVRLIETGNAVALVPGLVHVGVDAQLRLIELPDGPRRTVFTASRESLAEHPGVQALRRALTDEVEELGIRFGVDIETGI